MSDQYPHWSEETGPTGAPQPPQPQWAPPTAPPSPAVAGPAIQPPPQMWDGSGSSTSFDVNNGPGKRVALIAAVLGAAVLLLGAGWFAVRALTASDGADSPEAATDALVDAINNSDFLTMAELLEPGERRAIATPVLFEIIPELQRLGILGDDFDSGDTDGLVIQLTDATYRVERPADSPDVAFVYFTGGTATTSFDVDEFSFGDRVRQEIDEDPSIADELGQTETEQLVSDTPLVMVERDGRWYVSMIYSVMESAFPGELPAQVTGLTPVGADSPEAAVEAMLQAAVGLDLRTMIQGLEPGEMHALHRYSPLFLDDAQQALDDFQASLDEEGVTFALSDLDLQRNDDGDTAIVEVRGFAIDIRGGSAGSGRIEYGRERIAIDIDVAEGPIGLTIEVTPTSLTIDGTVQGDVVAISATGSSDRTSWTLDGRVGEETLTGSLEIGGDCWPYVIDDGTGPSEGCLVDELGGELFTPSDLPTEFGGLPMVVAETDGQWYVSPIGTIMHGVVQGLRDLDESEVEAWFADGGSIDGGLFDFGELVLGDGLDDMGGGFDSSTTTAFQAPLAVSAGQTVAEVATLGDGENHRWTVQLGEGEALAATLYPDGADGISDPVLDVYDEFGGLVGGNDDYDGLNSGLRLQGPGVFELEARDLSASGGGYRLTVEVAADLDSLTLAPDAVLIGAPPSQPSTGAGEPQVEDVVIVDLAAGPLVLNGSVGDNAFDEYVVEATGQPILIELVAAPDSVLDPLLVVRDEFGTEIALNDDDPSGELPFLSSRIALEAPVGTLTIEARSLANIAGDYEIRISLP
ncbi:MAG: hypothetical protein AAGA93_02040 [Actinomycetota bacterium]